MESGRVSRASEMFQRERCRGNRRGGRSVFGRMIPLHPRFSRAAILAGASLTLFASAGCIVAERRPHRPAPVVETVVVIREAPPPLRREIVVERERPSARHVWIAGFWRHDGRVYMWVPGRWEVPPHARAVWVEPRWEFRGGTHIFIEGVWR